MRQVYTDAHQATFFAKYLSNIYWGALRYIVYAYWGIVIFLNLIMFSQAMISANIANEAILGTIIGMFFILFFAPFEGLWSIAINSAYSFNGSGLLPLIGAVSIWVIIIDSIRWLYRKLVSGNKEASHGDLKTYIKSKKWILICIYTINMLVNLIVQNFESALIFSLIFLFVLPLSFPIFILSYHIKYPKETIVEPENFSNE